MVKEAESNSYFCIYIIYVYCDFTINKG